MKGNHLKKPITLKNWKTNRIHTYESANEFVKKHNIPAQVICDIRHGRRETYGDFSLPELSEEKYYKCRFKNLQNNKVYKYRDAIIAAKKTGISAYTLRRLNKFPHKRYKHFAGLNFNDFNSIPRIRFNNGQVKDIYHIADYVGKSATSKYRLITFYLKQQRITGGNGFKVLGVKDYKYLILDKKTGKYHKCRYLKDFANKVGIKPQKLYIRNDRYYIKEG